jgi:hypothetical protein
MCRDDGWEGEVSAEPKNGGEWRLAISDWWMTFLEVSAFALPKT